MFLVLTHFHGVKGPVIFLNYPENIPSSVRNKVLRFFDLDIEEEFFEIVLINQGQRIVNLYFEIPSEWARGGVEMAMISVIMKTEYDSTLIYDFLKEIAEEIILTDKVFKSFYKYDDFHYNDIEIDLNYEILKKILRRSLERFIEKLTHKNMK
jgi:hypothetical protein